jgi:hypothetical protein
MEEGEEHFRIIALAQGPRLVDHQSSYSSNPLIGFGHGAPSGGWIPANKGYHMSQSLDFAVKNASF